MLIHGVVAAAHVVRKGPNSTPFVFFLCSLHFGFTLFSILITFNVVPELKLCDFDLFRTLFLVNYSFLTLLNFSGFLFNETSYSLVKAIGISLQESLRQTALKVEFELGAETQFL